MTWSTWSYKRGQYKIHFRIFGSQETGWIKQLVERAENTVNIVQCSTKEENLLSSSVAAALSGKPLPPWS